MMDSGQLSTKAQIARTTSLAVDKIRKARSMAVSSDNHEGEKSVHEKLSSNFDKEPRWLRPKTDADVEARLAKLESMPTRRSVHEGDDMPSHLSGEDPSPSKITFIHKTAQEFFMSGETIEYVDGHPLVASKPSIIINADVEQASSSLEEFNAINDGKMRSSPPCPYFRRTPNRLDRREFQGWSSVKRLKEHLYRKHGFVQPKIHDCRDRTVDQDLQRPRTWSPSDASLRGIKSFEVPGTINGIPVNALPDWGSAVDAVSEDFAKQKHLEIKRTGAQHIQLLGGHKAESVGQVIGFFKFRGESRAHRRVFHVLRKSMCDVILGRKFLNLTSTLTENYHRIVERIRPCIQSKGRLFLLDESPDERIPCTVNGAKASAFPDTGSDLMLVSGDFARRHNLKVRREEWYRRQVELIDGSTVLTDGMVLNAELQFDTAPSASREVDYDRYCRFAEHLSSITNPNKTDATPRSTFVCDLHVIEGLPCDIILSNEFIFQNRVFSRFKDLFCPMSVLPSPGAIALDRSILFVRNKANKKSWLSRLRQAADNPEPEPIPLQAGTSWEERWVAEESRRNRAQLLIATLPHPRRSEAQGQEDEIRNAWDRGNPRPTPMSRLSSRNRPPPQPQVPRTPPRAMPPIPRRPVGAARLVLEDSAKERVEPEPKSFTTS